MGALDSIPRTIWILITKTQKIKETNKKLKKFGEILYKVLYYTTLWMQSTIVWSLDHTAVSQHHSRVSPECRVRSQF